MSKRTRSKRRSFVCNLQRPYVGSVKIFFHKNINFNEKNYYLIVIFNFLNTKFHPLASNFIDLPSQFLPAVLGKIKRDKNKARLLSLVFNDCKRFLGKDGQRLEVINVRNAVNHRTNLKFIAIRICRTFLSS